MHNYKQMYAQLKWVNLYVFGLHKFCECPYHLSLALRTLSVMHANPMMRRMSSFLFLSFRVRPRIQRNILISVLSRRSSLRLLNVHASEPYISTGLIIVLYTFPLTAMGILQSHNTSVNSCHFFHAAAILALMSSSLPPWASITEPRYLKFSTCFGAFPLLSVICRDSAVFAYAIVSVVLSAFTLRPLPSRASCHSLNLS